MPYDVSIIGTGPAGLTAGAYAGRSGLDILFFEDDSIGGELVNRHKVRSYPGFPEGVAGTELRSQMVESAEKHDPDIQLERVEEIDPGDPHVLRTEDGEYESNAVIVATGSTDGQLDVPGADMYAGRGIFYCATCDGPLYRDERIAVVGGGSHAIIDAVFLTEYASEVVVIESSSNLPADETLAEEARAHPDIKVMADAAVLEVTGEDGVVTGLRVEDGSTGKIERHQFDGINVHSGAIPNTEFLEETVTLDDDGRIIVDSTLEASVAGIFAAGDVRQGSPLEIAAAVGDGATAIASAKRFLDTHSV